MYYTVKYSGPFGFIKPWTAVRDGETFSLMETVALAISDNANQIAYAIRGELRDDTERPQASPRIDEQAKADIFVTPVASSYIPGAIGSMDTLDKAEQKLIEQMNAFDCEHQN